MGAETRWSYYECEADGCSRRVKWELVYCTVCAAKLGRNHSRNDKKLARYGVRKLGQRGW